MLLFARLSMYIALPASTTIMNVLHLLEQHQLQGEEGIRVFCFFKEKTAYEIGVRLVGSEMCIRDSMNSVI